MKRIKSSLRYLAALILVQSLFFKFSGASESIYIFETVGLEPVGRIAIGIVELIAAILLIVPQTVWLGAALALGTISGALFFHFTLLGIEVQQDGGFLFIIAVVVFVSSGLTLWWQKSHIPLLKL